MRKIGCASPKPSPTMSGSGGHMMEVKSTEAALCLGGTSVTPDGHGLLVWGVTACLSRMAMVGENVFPSLTEMVFWRANIPYVPILMICVCLWCPLSQMCIILGPKRLRNSLKPFHFLRELNKAKCYESPSPGRRMHNEHPVLHQGTMGK